MKYCPECGLELKKLDKEFKKSEVKTPTSFKKYRISSSILTIISASLCLIFAIIALMYSTGGSHYDSYALRNIISNIHLFAAAFGFFSFFMGILSGVSIIYKKSYNIAFNMQFIMIISALLTVLNHIAIFLVLGVPILTMMVISLFMLSFSKKDFS